MLMNEMCATALSYAHGGGCCGPYCGENKAITNSTVSSRYTEFLGPQDTLGLPRAAARVGVRLRETERQPRPARARGLASASGPVGFGGAPDTKLKKSLNIVECALAVRVPLPGRSLPNRS